MAKPVGRPSKLTPALIQRATQYVVATEGHRTILPTVEGMARALGIHKDTIYEWAELVDVPAEQSTLKQEFSDVVKDLKDAQAEKLMQLSLIGKYNPTIAKLILSGKHGYVEKTAQDVNHSGDVSFNNSVPRPTDGATA